MSRVRETWACILIGGQSSRMGNPKHLLEEGETTWLEKNVRLLQSRVDGVALSGKGDIPETLTDLVRLEDVDGAKGPLAGILSALRYQPEADWLVLACDMPSVTTRAVDWLLEKARTCNAKAVIPLLPGKVKGEPLFAFYRAESAPLFETLLRHGEFRLRAICTDTDVLELEVAAEHAEAWRNVNTPEELQLYRQGGNG